MLLPSGRDGEKAKRRQMGWMFLSRKTCHCKEMPPSKAQIAGRSSVFFFSIVLVKIVYARESIQIVPEVTAVKSQSPFYLILPPSIYQFLMCSAEVVSACSNVLWI